MPAELLCVTTARFEDVRATVTLLKTVKAAEGISYKVDHPSRNLRKAQAREIYNRKMLISSLMEVRFG